MRLWATAPRCAPRERNLQREWCGYSTVFKYSCHSCRACAVCAPQGHNSRLVFACSQPSHSVMQLQNQFGGAIYVTTACDISPGVRYTGRGCDIQQKNVRGAVIHSARGDLDNTSPRQRARSDQETRRVHQRRGDDGDISSARCRAGGGRRRGARRDTQRRSERDGAAPAEPAAGRSSSSSSKAAEAFFVVALSRRLFRTFLLGRGAAWYYMSQ